MNILVCVKSVPDLDMVIPGDWDIFADGEPCINYVNHIMNYYDSCALELALRLRDEVRAQGKEAFVTVLTVGTADSERILKEAYAAGADRCVRAEAAGDQYGAAETAGILSAFVNGQNGFNIVLCGSQAGNYDHGQTGYILAETLNIPCFQDVTALYREGSCAGVVMERDGVIERITVSEPCVGIVGTVKGLCLRMPTLKDRLKARERLVEHIDFERGRNNDHLSGAGRRVTLSRVKRERTCVILGMDEFCARARELLCVDGEREE